VSFDSDNEAILDEGELGLLGVGKARGLGASLEVIMAVGTAKELLLKGAFDGVAADAHFDGAGASRIDQGKSTKYEQKASGKKAQEGNHKTILSLKAGRKPAKCAKLHCFWAVAGWGELLILMKIRR
jgi:hypothetical protein